jgi:glycerophosphoryl diester phosphodiesterase
MNMRHTRNPLRAGATLPKRVWNIAHRGARAFAPENTLEAFAKAKTFACPMFEMDVHRTKDGELIVHHDDQLTRCTDVRKKFPRRHRYYVSDFTLAELKTLDAGRWYVRQIGLPVAEREFFLQTLTDEEVVRFVRTKDLAHYASGTVRLPTLRETLDFAQAAGMMVNIEIKTLPRMYPNLTADVVELVIEMHMEGRVLISSFDHEQLLEVRRLSDVIPTGVLTCDRLANPGEYLRLLDADAYNPGCYGDYDSLGFHSVTGKLDARGIRSARDAGRGVNVWTCNDPDQMKCLIEAGVSGLISDFPNRVREVLRRSVVA